MSDCDSFVGFSVKYYGFVSLNDILTSKGYDKNRSCSFNVKYNKAKKLLRLNDAVIYAVNEITNDLINDKDSESFNCNINKLNLILWYYNFPGYEKRIQNIIDKKEDFLYIPKKQIKAEKTLTVKKSDVFDETKESIQMVEEKKETLENLIEQKTQIYNSKNYSFDKIKN